MAISAQRKKLHTIIDALSAGQLNALAEFAGILQNSRLPVSRSSRYTADELVALVEKIRSSPFSLDNISEPAVLWADYVACAGEIELPFDAAAWNAQWDAIENEMEASSLAHEALERQQNR